MAHVPEGRLKDGTIYGGQEVNLVNCSLCGNLYAQGAENEHALTVTHISAKAAK
jgi:hypothetical protein